MQENVTVHRLEESTRIGSSVVDPRRAQRQRVGQVQVMKKRKGIRSEAQFARVRSGLRTGTTPHFAAWMADLNVARALHAVKLEALADSLDLGVAGVFATLFVKGRVRNVLQLSKMRIEDLLPIVGGDLDGLAAVEAYLNSQRVRLNWTAA